MARLRAGAYGFAVVVALLALWQGAAQAVTQTANVVARDARGHILPVDPLLTAGDRVQLTVTGFGPNAPLAARLGSTPLGSYRADAHGVVQFSFVVPRALGRGEYLVVAIGTPPLRSLSPSYEATSATYDPQGVEAVVPNLGIFAFRLDPGHTSGPPSSPHTSTPNTSTPNSGGGSSGQAGGLGHTGVNVLALLVAAAIAIAGGVLIWLPGRRRRHA